MRMYCALSTLLLIAWPGFATTETSPPNGYQPTLEARCGQGHANWVRQCGQFSWQGRGFNWETGEWIWQKPARPKWPNVKVMAHIASPWDWDDECDDDHDRDRGWGDRCGGQDPNHGGQNPPDLSPRATLTMRGYDIRFHLANLGRAERDGSLIAHITGTLTFDTDFMWVGLHMPGKADKIERDEWGMPTGVIVDGMVPRPQGRCYSRNRPFNMEVLLNDGVSGDGGYRPPEWYGPVPGGTEAESLYWGIAGPGTFPLDWTVRLRPGANQGTGVYDFDPVVVLRPADHTMTAPAQAALPAGS